MIVNLWVDPFQHKPFRRTGFLWSYGCKKKKEDLEVPNFFLLGWMDV
jgi:hypothetical protein